jgi:hypothetical protein
VTADAMHPLAVAMGDGWRWLGDHQAQQVVLLHRGGLHTTLAVVMLWPHWKRKELWRPMADALNQAVAEGVTGAVYVTSHDLPSGRVRVEVDPCP